MSPANRIHFMVEAKKKAFQDRFRLLGDYEGVGAAVADILTEAHTAKVISEIDTRKASNTPCKEQEEGSDTTYFLIVDDEGTISRLVTL
jgi:gamma-glutamyltranspeptidase / glutathione hydrolase